jgi:hypothetical protein
MRLEVTPALVDLIVAAVALELAGATALLWRARLTRWLTPLFLYLASGACLLLALRAALSGAGSDWIAAALLASLVAHGASLIWAWRALFRQRHTGGD